MKQGLRLPEYTGANSDALNASLAAIDVPEETALRVALDHVDPAPRSGVLLDVLAEASRWWLLFGRIFGILARVDDPGYEVDPLADHLTQLGVACRRSYRNDESALRP